MSRDLVTAFRATVERVPDTVALVDGDDRICYRALAHWVDAVASGLTGIGVEPGDRVGICLARGASVVAGILGVLACGAAYVPLDPSYPAERLQFMAGDAGLAAVLSDHYADRFGGVPVVPVPTRDDATPCPAPVMPVDASAAAYVIYTSGSTGAPKGVVVSHANVLSLFDGAQPLFEFGPDEVWTLFHSYSFDFSVWELWGPLLYGGTLVCVPDAVAFDRAALHRLLLDEGVTVLNMVPSVFRHLVAGHDEPLDGIALRHVVFGGEPVDTTAVRRWLDRMPAERRPRVVNMYGITETTVHVTYRLLGEADFGWPGPGTLIGTPLPHLTIRLLDTDGREVPDGEPGEMVVFGGGVASGYLGREELTAQRFPALPGPDGGVGACFRSGDIALWSSEHASLVYLGRRDDQVKVRGFRIELGEIEESLRRCSHVRDAAVSVQQSADGDPILAAFVVLHDGAGESAAAMLRSVRADLRRTLPRHMVPGPVRVLDELPRTSSGKLDRRALRA